MSEPGAVPDWAAGPAEDDETDAPEWAAGPAESTRPQQAPSRTASAVTSKPLASFDPEEPEVRGRINMAPLTEVVGDVARDDEIALPDPIRRGMEFVVNDLRRSTMSPAERSADRAHGRAYSAAAVNPLAAPVAMMDDLSGHHLDEIGGALRSGAVSGEDYRREQQESRRRLDELERRNPISRAAGGVGALGVMAALPGLGGIAGEAAAARGAGAIAQGAARLGGAALEGAGWGAYNASGSSEHEFGSGEYAGDVGGGSALGALYSGGGQAVLGELPRVARWAGEEVAQNVGQRAAALRARATGARTNHLENANRTFPGGLEGLADTLRQEGLTGTFDRVQDILPRAQQLRDRAGQELGDILTQASRPVEEAAEGAYRSSATVPGMMTADDLAARIQREVVDDLERAAPREHRRIARELNEMLDNVQADQSPMTPARVQDLQRQIDDLISYNNTGSLDQLRTQVMRKVRGIVREELDTSLARAGEALGDPEMLQRYERARRAYGAASRVDDWGSREVMRHASHRQISPTDYATGIAATMTSGPAGIGMMLANRIFRDREHSMFATGLEGLQRFLQRPQSASVLSPAVRQALTNAAQRGGASFAAATYAATMNASPEEREAIQQAMEGGAPSQETAP